MSLKNLTAPTSIKLTDEQRDWVIDQVKNVPVGCKLSGADVVRATVEAARTKKTVVIVVVQTAYDGAALDLLQRVKRLVEAFKDRVRDVKATSIYGDEKSREKAWELITDANELLGEARRLVQLMGGLSSITLAEIRKTVMTGRRLIALPSMDEAVKAAWKEILAALEVLGLAKPGDTNK